MDLLSATLHCADTTMVEWRRADGTVLASATVAAGNAIDCNDLGMLPYSYDVWARPADGSADWMRVFEIDPVNRSVARFDL